MSDEHKRLAELSELARNPSIPLSERQWANEEADKLRTRIARRLLESAKPVPRTVPEAVAQWAASGQLPPAES